MRYDALFAAMFAVVTIAHPVYSQNDDERERALRLRNLQHGDLDARSIHPKVRAFRQGHSRSAPAAPISRGMVLSARPAGPTAAMTDGRATRLFAGPGQFPPAKYAAYGIVAFRALSGPSDREHYLDICRAYLNAIPPVPPDLPEAQQMVTVWPVASEVMARDLNATSAAQKCERAVDNYDLSLARDFIRKAKIQGVEIDGVGPYLLAWAPTANIGRPDAVVLVYDLSGIPDYEGAVRMMMSWVEDIESDPTIWEQGLKQMSLREKIRGLVDKYGAKFEAVFKVKT